MVDIEISLSLWTWQTWQTDALEKVDSQLPLSTQGSTQGCAYGVGVLQTPSLFPFLAGHGVPYI